MNRTENLEQKSEFAIKTKSLIRAGLFTIPVVGDFCLHKYLKNSRKEIRGRLDELKESSKVLREFCFLSYFFEAVFLPIKYLPYVSGYLALKDYLNH
jgi:hypothetical protein